MSDIAPEVPADAVIPADAGNAVPAEAAAPAPVEPVPVVQQTPSNAADESIVEKIEEKVVDIFEAAKRLIGLVEQHRTIGDAEVGAAVADVKSVLPVEAPAESDAAQA